MDVVRDMEKFICLFNYFYIYYIHLLVGLKCPTTNISAKFIFISRSYFIALCVWSACARCRAFRTKSVKFSGESQCKSSCTSDSKMKMFP